MSKKQGLGTGLSIVLLLLALGLLAGAIIAGIAISPELCAHNHQWCP